MTTDKITDLLQRSTQGDREAIQALMELGDDYLKEGDIANAARAFKEAAISFRIDAFRQRTRLEEEEKESGWQKDLIENLFLGWLRANSKVLPAKRPEILEIPEGKLAQILQSGELADRSIAVDFLVETLMSLGVEFYSPGGSPMRRILQLLRAFGGDERSWGREFLDDVRVRIALDHLVDRTLAASKRSKA